MSSEMDHSHYPYKSNKNRVANEWPGRARIAVWVVLHLEYYELYPPEHAIQDPRYRSDFGNYSPDYRTYSIREYGNRIGIFRILEVLNRHGVRATVAANSLALEKRESVGKMCISAGHEICAHGVASSQLVSSRISAATEFELIRDSRNAVERATGKLPQGWIAQDFGESFRTPSLIAEAGFDWIGNWPNDDEPYLMTTDPPIVSIPFQNEWDDAQTIVVRRLPVWKWQEIAVKAFEVLYAEGGRVFGLGLHPWVIGHPHRIRYLDRVLTCILRKRDVWLATGTEIASAFSDRMRPVETDR